MPTAEALSHVVDDATVVYILETRRYFEDLRQVASQLAGLLVLAAANRLTDVDPVLIPLRAGYAALQEAANALPGFELISFERACCGIHLPNEVKPA